MKHHGDVNKINGAEVEPFPIAVTKSRFKEVTQKMTTIHTADDGWQFAEIALTVIAAALKPYLGGGKE